MPAPQIKVGDNILGVEVIQRLPDVVRPNGKLRPIFLCRCVCGNTFEMESQSIHYHRKSEVFGCKGCLNKHFVPLDGTVVKSTKCSWSHMLRRCNNPKEAGYKDYGGRGISVCDDWYSFSNFFRDMGLRPKGTVIDRIDPNGNYCKENCRWADRTLSAYNTRKSITNTSGRTGVYWFDRVGKWTAAIFINGIQTHLGYFNSFEEAVKAREDAEISIFGFNKE